MSAIPETPRVGNPAEKPLQWSFQKHKAPSHLWPAEDLDQDVEQSGTRGNARQVAERLLAPFLEARKVEQIGTNGIAEQVEQSGTRGGDQQSGTHGNARQVACCGSW